MKTPFVLSALILFGCHKAQPEPPPIRPVRWAQIGQSGAATARSFAAVIQASQQSTLAFRVSGSLQALQVKNGSKVDSGTVIAKLEHTDYANRVEQAAAQVRSAQSQVNVTRPGYQRAERLYQSNTASLADFQSAKGAFEAAQAQLQAALKQLEASRNQLAYATLKAPYSGTVSQVHVDEGEVVNAGTPVVTLSSGEALEVQVEVPESLIASVQVGDPLALRCAATGDQNLSALVSEVGFAASKGGAFSVTARLDHPPAALRPGMAATVLFPVDKRANVLRVPVAAVADDGHRTYVYRLQKKDSNSFTVHKQEVELGTLSSQGFVLQGGLEAGDRVVTAGLHAMFEGLQVRLLDDTL